MDDLDRLRRPFSQKAAVLEAAQKRVRSVVTLGRLGPPRGFRSLWQETGCTRGPARQLLADPPYRVTRRTRRFLTVLHRLGSAGSARAAARWKHDYALKSLPHLNCSPLPRWTGRRGLPPSSSKDPPKLRGRAAPKEVVEEKCSHAKGPVH